MRFFSSLLVLSLAATTAFAQTAAPTQSTQQAAAKPKKRVVRHRTGTSANPNVRTIGIETTPPTAATAQSGNREAARNAADQRLLEQQQAQSAAAGRVNDQIVKTAEQQQNRQQREVRIQDAPGPAQTGVVPAAGLPVAPDTRIQDAPGPAQTLSPPVSSQPAGTQPQVP